MLQSWGAGWYLWLQKVRCLALTSVCTFLMSLRTIRSTPRSSYQENAQLKTSSAIFDTSISAQLSTRKKMRAGRALGSLSVETIVEDSKTFIPKWDKTISCRAWHPPSWSTHNQASKDTFPHFIITIINNWLIVSSVYGFLLLTNIVFMINNVHWWSGDSVIYCEPSSSVSLTG